MAGFGRAMIREEQGAHTPDGQYAFELSETGMLGAGAHGIVRAAQNKDTGEWVAVKLMPTSVLGAITKELIALAKVEHPNIVRLMGTQVDLDNKRVYMVMVRRRPLRPLPPPQDRLASHPPTTHPLPRSPATPRSCAAEVSSLTASPSAVSSTSRRPKSTSYRWLRPSPTATP